MASTTEPIDDSISARITPTCPIDTSEILLRAWQHDLPAIQKLLDAPGKASAREPTTGETPSHAAIRSCGPTAESDAESVEKAKAVVSELLQWGGIWNDVDDHDETPGCVAYRLGQTELYDMCVEAGVRAELLFGLMNGYEELSSGSEEDDEDMVDGEDGEEEDEEDGEEKPCHVEIEYDGPIGAPEDGDDAPELVETAPPVAELAVEAPETDVNSEQYLKSKITYSDGKLVDDKGNGVMMAWETDIMRRSVDVLLPEKQPGKRILNIGFGMGIIDSMFAETKPARHHIIEAHEGVLEHTSSPDSAFGPGWEASGPDEGAYKIHQGRWQDIVPILLERGEVYDAIYFDTFGEDYSQLRKFFTEYIPGLLDQGGVFSFFNGLGADRRICYDVYTRVVEMHLADAGMDVEWSVIDVDLKGLEEAGKGEWEGVRRRYWTLDRRIMLVEA
ncbi:Arginine N-methyltransferase 2 [Cytospora paraplurivora]|uniref:Arginine N-methyltransferase 2 n=1 Tax=Cytospora paraplurivora TaxID=2898453 RepID=A0AAN9YF56_9PEZI